MDRSSRKLFVRGKYQLARYEPGSNATGRRLTEHEVVAAYGRGIIGEIDERRSAVLLTSRRAIEEALGSRRAALGVKREQIAAAANLDIEVVENAETDADRVAIRDLEHLAFVLGLDSAQLGVDEKAGADTELGVRLRVLTHPGDDAPDIRLSPQTTLRFSESASIIESQFLLRDWLAVPGEMSGVDPSDDYGPPAWRKGYQLAQQARARLGVSQEPIPSMRELVEHRLGIPIIQVELPDSIAGATLSSNGRRGIVLNTGGANTNVWIRRTTLAHELAHILFDPQERLSSIRVDSYEQLQRNTRDTDSLDDVEQRANAFAVEFLAPQDAVRQLVSNTAQVKPEDIAKVMYKFGIGRVAALFHISNAWWGQIEVPPASSIQARPTDEQRAAEDFTQDFFPIHGTPPMRRGRFALLVAQAFDGGLITADTAARYLACTEDEFRHAKPHLLDLV